MRAWTLVFAAVAFPAQAADKCPKSGESTGFTGFAQSKYYECARTKAAELERSGEDARTVAVAAENQCPLELQLLVEAYDDCFGRGNGTRLAPEMRNLAVNFATGEVVKLRAKGSAALSTLGITPSIAQAPPQVMLPVAAPVVAVQPPMTNAVLRTGTEIPLRLVEELTTKEKKLRVGNRFRLETSEPIIVQGVIVIPAGSPAVGEITDVRNKGMWGKSGRLVARLLYVTANGRQVRLSGGFDDKGTAGGVGAVAASALIILPVGFFMTGTSAKIPMGTVVKGFIDEDVPLSIPSETTVMVVGAPPATMTVPTATPEK